MVLDNVDIIDSSEADAEILGAGAVMAFAIITPLMLLAYAVEGRDAIKVNIENFCLLKWQNYRKKELFFRTHLWISF